jgi:predicted PurR-regulated permease PerM
MKRIMLYTAVVLTTVAGFYLLWQFRLILLLLVLSLSVAALFRPFIEALIQRGAPRGVAPLLVYLIVAGGFLVFILMAGDALMGELNEAANNFVIEYELLHRRWADGLAWQQAIVGQLPLPFALENVREMDIGEMLPSIMNVTTGAAGLIAGVLLVLALGLYWSVDQVRFERLWLSLLPARRRAIARDSWRDMEATIGSYLRSQVAQSLLAAMALGTVAWLTGFPYPILLAFAGALGAFIPLFGGVLAVLAALALGSLQSSGMAIAAALYTGVVFIVLELLVEPRLWPRERRSMLLVLLVIIPMVEAFGLWGLLAAPLLAAVAETIIRHGYGLIIARNRDELDLEELAARYRLLSDQIDLMEDGDLAPELRSLNERLSALLASSQTLAGDK